MINLRLNDNIVFYEIPYFFLDDHVSALKLFLFNLIDKRVRRRKY